MLKAVVRRLLDATHGHRHNSICRYGPTGGPSGSQDDAGTDRIYPE